MNFKNRAPRYTAKFYNHLSLFITNFNLFTGDSSLLVAVSGGIDSMALLHALVSLRNYGYSFRVRAIHINHNTRVGQADEAKLVKDYCKYLGVELVSTKLKGLKPYRDFENQARIKRYDTFYKYKKPQELIVLGHHIDDSFEWTLLQSLRSSSIDGLVGIPLVNGDVIRPFMCMTKSQIVRYVNAFDLPFLEDPTNESLRHERNFIRHSIVESFKQRYPNYLKNYVFRHNEIARRLGIHLVDKSKTSFNISYSENSVLIYSASTYLDTSGLNDLLVKGIKAISKETRGSLRSQVNKIIQALTNHKYGPLTVVSGIKVFLDFNCLLICHHDFKQSDTKFSGTRKFSFDDYKDFIIENYLERGSHLLFPFFVIISAGNIDKKVFNTSFNVDIALSLKQEGVSFYPALKLLREWSKKRNKHKILHLKFITVV